MKRTKRFDAGGMASSGPQYAFEQPRSSGDTGVGGVPSAPLPGPLNLGQAPMQDEQPMQQMRKGGKVKGYAAGGSVTRADGCCRKGRTRGKFV